MRFQIQSPVIGLSLLFHPGRGPTCHICKDKVSTGPRGRLRQLFVARSHTQLSWFHATVQIIAGFVRLNSLAMGGDALLLNRGGALLVALHEVEEPHFR